MELQSFSGLYDAQKIYVHGFPHYLVGHHLVLILGTCGVILGFL